jgi:hypothetical protein
VSHSLNPRSLKPAASSLAYIETYEHKWQRKLSKKEVKIPNTLSRWTRKAKIIYDNKKTLTSQISS